MDIERIKRQEAILQFQNFDATLAWDIGSRLQNLARIRNLVVAIEIHLTGQPLFFCAMDGTAPDHGEWLRRKRNTVMRFHKSSYLVGLELQQQNTTLTQKLGLPISDYSSHGGGFPIRMRGFCENTSIVVGSIGVSGLPQREDHGLIIEVLAEVLMHKHNDLALT